MTLDTQPVVAEPGTRLQRERVSPLLADGVTVSDLFDPVRREVAMRVLSDPEIYRLELARIHQRSWVAVAHVSEVSKAGDFVVRRVGDDSVIVTRSEDGAVSVLLNVCAHRGMEVCWADAGTSRTFKCPNHGWVYDARGQLLGAPLEKRMYGDWDKSKYGLRTARVEVRSGVVFATFDTTGVTLDDWLGDAAWYLEQTDSSDMEVVGSPWRFRVPSNWKLFMDQAAGDGYHTYTLHYSQQELGLVNMYASEETYAKALDAYASMMVKVSTPQGHGIVGGYPTGGRSSERLGKLFGAAESKTVEDNGSGTPADGESAMSGGYTLELFPQTIITPGRHQFPDGSSYATGQLININPYGPDSHEWHILWLIDKAAPAEIKTKMRRMGAPQMSYTHLDDFEQSPSQQRAATGHLGQQQPLRYFAEDDVIEPKAFPGPGTIHPGGFGRDTNQWRMWERWYELMTDEAAPAEANGNRPPSGGLLGKTLKETR